MKSINDRATAGRNVARALRTYAGKDVIVLARPQVTELARGWFAEHFVAFAALSMRR